MDKKLDKNNVVEATEDELVSESRRKFVQAAGKVAVYTPPAMLLLSNPSSEAFAQSAGSRDSRRAQKKAARKKARVAKKTARKTARAAKKTARKTARKAKRKARRAAAD